MIGLFPGVMNEIQNGANAAHRAIESTLWKTMLFTTVTARIVDAVARAAIGLACSYPNTCSMSIEESTPEPFPNEPFGFCLLNDTSAQEKRLHTCTRLCDVDLDQIGWCKSAHKTVDFVLSSIEYATGTYYCLSLHGPRIVGIARLFFR